MVPTTVFDAHRAQVVDGALVLRPQDRADGERAGGAFDSPEPMFPGFQRGVPQTVALPATVGARQL